MTTKVHVDTCWGGGGEFHFRVSCGNQRFSVSASTDATWTRRDASRVLDMVESEFGLHRRNVRFILH